MTTHNSKKALVTGSTRGIGKSIAKLLCESGYDVFLTGRNEELLKSLKQEINAKSYYVFDLLEENACNLLMDAVGDVDILVNNAGDYVYSPLEKTSCDDVKRLLRLNVEVPFLLTKLAVKSMKEKCWGRIVNIGSISGAVGEANASLYSLTKSAFSGFTKSLALELAQDNITVNTIHPGWVETDLACDAVAKSDFSYQEELDMIPQRRFIHPDEIANLVKYMVSEDAKGMTGQCVSLCAGLSAG